MRIKQDMPISKFINVKEDKNGVLKSISFEHADTFNFAFDIVDAIADREPDRRAMIHISSDGKERIYTFGDMKKHSARIANYLSFIGIKKGDRVMLVLKRHYQFWFAILALHKIGAVAVPATNMLLKSDFEYRFKKGNIDAILCTADGYSSGGWNNCNVIMVLKQDEASEHVLEVKMAEGSEDKAFTILSIGYSE